MTTHASANTIDIVVNGQPRRCAAKSTIADLLQQLDLANVATAVELNQEIVPRADYRSRQLGVDDRLEIVTLTGGG